MQVGLAHAGAQPVPDGAAEHRLEQRLAELAYPAGLLGFKGSGLPDLDKEIIDLLRREGDREVNIRLPRRRFQDARLITVAGPLDQKIKIKIIDSHHTLLKSNKVRRFAHDYYRIFPV